MPRIKRTLNDCLRKFKDIITVYMWCSATLLSEMNAGKCLVVLELVTSVCDDNKNLTYGKYLKEIMRTLTRKYGFEPHQ